MSRVELRIGDLLEQHDADVIVNAWNRNFIPWWLLLPSGVSGAIKKRGGFAPFRELRRFGVLAAGDAVVTGAGRLPFRAIIHVAALNAFWVSSEAIIRRCTINALNEAAKIGAGTIAVPLIGAGTGGVAPTRSLEGIREEAERHAFTGRVLIVSREQLPGVSVSTAE